MPYASEAQERYFNANREKLEKQGVDVNEWNAASKGMKLPYKVGAKKPGRPHPHMLAHALRTNAGPSY